MANSVGNNDPLTVREKLLEKIVATSKDKHEKRSSELSGIAHKAELVLISWGFLFAGIAGFYQASVLNKDNYQQIVLLLLPITVSMFICVKFIMAKRAENDVPNIAVLWQSYIQAYNQGFSGYNHITLMEELCQAYIEAESINRRRLGSTAYMMTIASWMIILEIVMIAVFAIFKNIKVIF